MGYFRKAHGYRLGLLHQRGTFLPNNEACYGRKYVRCSSDHSTFPL